MFLNAHPCGIILSGIVGCGKTTLLNELKVKLDSLGFDVFSFDGDDVRFRTKVAKNTNFILEEMSSMGFDKAIVFVDEVQKVPEIFDALKIVFDKAKASFIVTGSNPEFLNTSAKDRLQRRADFKTLLPFSLSEILVHNKLIDNLRGEFKNNIFNSKSINEIDFKKIKRRPEIESVIDSYFIFGGLPLSYLSAETNEKLRSIKLVAERGITQTFQGTHAIDDEIRRYLATQNSKEFTYKGIHQRLRTTKRDVVDKVIDHLLNHGYLLSKRPYLHEFEFEKSTYFSTYSWIDPGIITYYQGNMEPSTGEIGFRLESYVHCLLNQILEEIPLSSKLYYFKPFKYKKSNDSLEFQKGEIDFIVKIGKRLVPIEVKRTATISEINTNLLSQIVDQWKSPFGVVVYGGAPYIDIKRKLFFYPFWQL